MQKVYMAVSEDEYELPELVADSANELAKAMGVTRNTVDSQVSRRKHGIVQRSKYVAVEIEDDEDET